MHHHRKKKRQIFDTFSAWRLVKLLKKSGSEFPPNSASVLDHQFNVIRASKD